MKKIVILLLLVGCGESIHLYTDNACVNVQSVNISMVEDPCLLREKVYTCGNHNIKQIIPQNPEIKK